MFKRILNYLSTIEPGNFSYHNLAKNLNVDDKTAANYVTILYETGLIRIVNVYAKGNQYLRKSEKVFLNNTILNYALNSVLGENFSTGLISELFFLQSLQNSNIAIFYSKLGDYRTKNYIFEIGSKNKKSHQVKEGNVPYYLVKDDILLASHREKPLLFFGFLH